MLPASSRGISRGCRSLIDIWADYGGWRWFRVPFPPNPAFASHRVQFALLRRTHARLRCVLLGQIMDQSHLIPAKFKSSARRWYAAMTSRPFRLALREMDERLLGSRKFLGFPRSAPDQSVLQYQGIQPPVVGALPLPTRLQSAMRAAVYRPRQRVREFAPPNFTALGGEEFPAFARADGTMPLGPPLDPESGMGR